MDEQRTTSPLMAFVPEGDLPNWPGPHLLRHASLPSEHVCTENLTPFLKLLPCKSLSGIASLLNPHRLFDADWHGMSVHVLWHANQGVEVRLSFQLVSDPLRQSSSKRRGQCLTIYCLFQLIHLPQIGLSGVCSIAPSTIDVPWLVQARSM